MATTPTSRPTGQPFPPRLIAPLVALNVTLLTDYLAATLKHADGLLSSMRTSERVEAEAALKNGRASLNKVLALKNNGGLLTDSNEVMAHTKLIAEMLQSVALIGDIIFKNLQTGTILNNRLVASILTASRTKHGR